MIRTAVGIATNVVRSQVGMRAMPRILTWTLNFRCNARCGMCDSWKKEDPDEMDTAASLAVIEKLPKSISAVRLTGGEPFLRNDIATVVRALEVKLQPELIHLTSNGFLTGKITGFLQQHAQESTTPIHLLLSLDGLEELHNEIRGQKFAFRTVLDTLRIVAQNRHRWGVELAVNQTIVDERGIAQYDALHALLAEWDVPHHVVIAYAESATYSTEKATDVSPTQAGFYETATPIDPEVFASFIVKLKRDAQKLPFGNRIAKQYYLKGIRNRVLDGVGVPNPACAALGGHMRMYPNGDIPVCQFNSQVIGNLQTHDFMDVWNAPKALEWHAWVQRCAGCWAECEVTPSALLSGDILRHTRKQGVAV